MSKLDDSTLATLNELSPGELLEETFDRFGNRAAIGTSFQKTGTVIIDLTARVVDDFRVYFVDTLRHPDETYEFIESVEARYGIDVDFYKPDPEELKELNQQQGQHGHLFSEQKRRSCCQVRKINPARRAEAELDAVVNGLRADQSKFRGQNMRKVYYDQREERPDILKVNPLFQWTESDVDEYIEEHGVEIHPLYDYESEYGEVYKNIGCATCHFPVLPDSPNRAGKYPWEKSEKECGLHYKNGGGI